MLLYEETNAPFHQCALCDLVVKNIKPQRRGEHKGRTMKTELITIQNKIYTLRGMRVMLDFDFAALYGVETRVLNQSVKRNIERFPDNFMFQLNKEKWKDMSSQFVTTSLTKRPKAALPLTFSEQGVSMLSAVLRSSIAINTSIQIMRAFVVVRQMLTIQPVDGMRDLRQEIIEMKAYVDEIFADQNDINEDTRMQLELINQTLAEMQVANKEKNYPRRKIGFIKE